jgi:hypothetical protein
MPHQQKIGDYFTACMDGPAVEKLEVTEATASASCSPFQEFIGR